MESHVRACLFAGLHIVGCNLEVLVGSMEYQLAPLDPVSVSGSACCSPRLARLRRALDFVSPGVW